jgi:sugar phosphate isomerase/epimerase
MKLELNRRSFLQAGLALAAAAPSGAAELRAMTLERAPIRLGAPLSLRTEDPEVWAKAHREKGYRGAYSPNLRLEDKERIEACKESCKRHDLVIAEVGRWVNLLDADPEKRRRNLEIVTDGLALAEALEARCCVDIAGSFNPDSWFGPHPDNLSQRFFDAAVENARKIIDAVKPKKTKFTYEMMAWSIPDSADSYLELLRAVDRPAFGVHLDPCNLVNSPARFYQNADLIRESYRKLAPWIASVHAKDLRWEIEMSIHFREVIPGTGAIDYETFLREHAALPGEVPLMLEHLASDQEYDQARDYIFQVGKQVGVSF